MKLNRSDLLHVLLALAILAGSLAVLPGTASAAAPDAPQGAAPRFTARIQGDRLIIDGSGFPSLRGFFVKARRNANFDWVRLGSLQADRSGVVHGNYRLPEGMRKAYSLRVCLKDLKNSHPYCVWAWRSG